MEWRDILGYEGYLQVSDTGQIRSVERYVNHRDGSLMLIKPKIIKSFPDPKGYLKVRTSVNNKKTCIKVHRAVAEAFIPNPEHKPQVDHIDGDKTNNNVSNLRWVSNRENYDFSVKNGIRSNSFAALEKSQKDPVLRRHAGLAAKSKCQKKTYCFDKNGNLIETYDSAKEAAKAYGGVPSGVSACCRGEMPTYKGVVFRYEK